MCKAVTEHHGQLIEKPESLVLFAIGLDFDLESGSLQTGTACWFLEIRVYVYQFPVQVCQPKIPSQTLGGPQYPRSAIIATPLCELVGRSSRITCCDKFEGLISCSWQYSLRLHGIVPIKARTRETKKALWALFVKTCSTMLKTRP